MASGIEKKPELLAPAGSFQKMKSAFHFGSDAVYAGTSLFSLRAYAENFSDPEFAEAVQYAHSLGKKLYAAANIFPCNADLPKATEYFGFLSEINADGVIITDPGFLSICKKVAPKLPIHLSTQANTLNTAAATFWRDAGVSRIILARELPLEDVREIARAVPEVELEAFVHGAMCVSYSGRCLLSNYISGRDANRGECVQPCRRSYLMTEEKSGDSFVMQEDSRGTYILNSKDLNMLGNISEMLDAGITSLKIEGRMKSEYYVATVVNAYRRALTEYTERGFVANAELLERELNKISHRDYTKAYAFGFNPDTISSQKSQTDGSAEFIALVTADYCGGYCEVEMRNRFRSGEELEILSPGESFGKRFRVGRIINGDGAEITDAKLVQERLKLEIPYPVSVGDVLRREA